MRDADRAQTEFVPLANVVRVEHRVGAFHAEDIAERRGGRVGFAIAQVLLQFTARANRPHPARTLHRAIVVQVAHRDRIARLGRGEAEGVIDRLFLPREQGRDAKSDTGGAEFGKADRVCHTTGFGHLERGFLRANLGNRHPQIAVPVHRIER